VKGNCVAEKVTRFYKYLSKSSNPIRQLYTQFDKYDLRKSGDVFPCVQLCLSLQVGVP
jgi:hypothetical protein